MNNLPHFRLNTQKHFLNSSFWPLLKNTQKYSKIIFEYDNLAIFAETPQNTHAPFPPI